MILNRHDPTAQQVTATTREDFEMYRHPVVDEVDYAMRSRWREASEQRLAARASRAAGRPSGVRRRLGAWLVRTGYSIGAPRPVA